MAKFKITPKTTVAELKEQFRNEVGGTLRVYEGRSEASDGATLVSLGAKEGELECRTSRTVGKFEEAFQSELNLKVKVYTKDNWVKVLDGITLAVAGQLPNGMTKSKMEEYLSYKREETPKAESAKAENEEDAKFEIPEQLIAVPLVDLDFNKFEMTDEEIDKNVEVLDVPGVIIIYAKDEDGDNESAVWVADSIYNYLVDNCREWTNQYEGEREFRYYVSTKKDLYGFPKDADQEDIDDMIGASLSDYVGSYGRNYSIDLALPLLIRAKWEDHTDIFASNEKGEWDRSWLDELGDKGFNELIRKTLAGENVIVVHAPCYYHDKYKNIRIREILSEDNKLSVEKLKEIVGSHGIMAIIAHLFLTNNKEIAVCAKGKTPEEVIHALNDIIIAEGSEIDMGSANVIFECVGYNIDSSEISPDDVLEILPKLVIYITWRRCLKSKLKGHPCILRDTSLEGEDEHSMLYEFDANGDYELLDDDALDDISKKFGIEIEEDMME